MEMITAGEIIGPDILPYNDAHKAVWRCLEARDRNGLSDALEAVTLHSADPLILAIAASALIEYERAPRAVALARECVARRPSDPQVAAVAQAVEADRDPFLGLPDAGKVPGNRVLALRGAVLMAVRGSDTQDMVVGFNNVLMRVAPGIDAVPCPAFASGSVIVNLFYPPYLLCIGGGAKCIYPFWVNVDIVAPPGAGPRLKFSPDTVLPLDDDSIEIVYSSHCLEHLDDPTVDRLLSEMRRVAMPAGRLVLKVPDGEEAIRQWQAGNRAFFDAPAWGLDSVAWSWAEHGVVDGIDSRMAMLFCGYWNEAMSRGGSLQELQDRGAFHGPPRIEAGELRRLAANGSPHALAQGLRERALQEDPAAIFNHQNAWSREELKALLQRHGFETRSMSPAEIMSRSGMIPDIGKYRDVSIYLEAEPRRVADGRFVSPPSGVNPSAQISEINAMAWVPRGLASLDACRWRTGLVAMNRLLWEYHNDMVRRLEGRREPSHFLSYGYAQGSVGGGSRTILEGIFENRPFFLETEDCRADGLNSKLRAGEVDDLRRNLRFFAPDERQRVTLEAFLAGIAPEIEMQLQRPWRVLNVRCYETTLSFRSGPQDWHRDGLPSAILKILIYLSPDGTAVGSELIDKDGEHVAVRGESGIWLLFDPNRLVHRGPPEGSDRRRIIEITLCGDLKTDTRYRFGGTNFRHPICPPSLDPFQQGLVLEATPSLMELQRVAVEISKLSGDTNVW